MLNPEIFRQYDIRGIAGKDMDSEGVYQIGRGIGTYLKRQGRGRISVGRDCRTTSDAYNERVIKGLTDSGLDVVDIGVCSTPVSYFSIRHLALDGSVMVTASRTDIRITSPRMARVPASMTGGAGFSRRSMIWITTSMATMDAEIMHRAQYSSNTKYW